MEDGKLAGCLTSIFLIITNVLVIVLDGYILSILWNWFFVNVFHVPSISIPGALGLSLIVDLLTHKADTRPKNRYDIEEDAMRKAIKLVATQFGYCLLALSIGFILHSYMH